MDEIKKDEMIGIVKNLSEIYGGPIAALEIVNRNPTPYKQRRAKKFIKRSLRIMARFEKGLPVKAKGGATI